MATHGLRNGSVKLMCLVRGGAWLWRIGVLRLQLDTTGSGLGGSAPLSGNCFGYGVNQVLCTCLYNTIVLNGGSMVEGKTDRLYCLRLRCVAVFVLSCIAEGQAILVV